MAACWSCKSPLVYGESTPGLKPIFRGRFFPRASRLAPRTEAPGLPPVGVNGRYVTANSRALTPLAKSASCFGITVMRKDLFGNYVVKYRLLAMKERPNCEVVNPDSAERCDCGYNFVSDPMRSTNSAARRAIRAVLKGIAGVAAVVWFLAPVTRYPGPLVFVVSTVVLLLCFVGLSLLNHAADMGWWPKKRDPKT